MVMRISAARTTAKNFFMFFALLGLA